MIEYGHGAASPGGTCFAPLDSESDATILCDRDRHHLGRHAAWDDSKGRRIYWGRRREG